MSRAAPPASPRPAAAPPGTPPPGALPPDPTDEAPLTPDPAVVALLETARPLTSSPEASSNPLVEALLQQAEAALND